MGSLMKKQAERFLREKKRHRRWLAMFLCLALVVTSGTFAALRMNGHAMDHGGKILNCRLRVHEHTDECYDSDGKLICGQADYVVHTHDGRCRNEEGELVCQLPEREAHVHDSSCYAEEKVLTCKEEETAGHQHSPECYIEEQGELVCTLPEHEHSDACYDETGNLICGQEAHMHDGSCYAVNEVLACGQEEGQGGHTHTDACYETQKKLICGELELHTHDPEKCYDQNGNLTCGKLELEEHEHGEGCFEDEEDLAGMDVENGEYLAGGEPENSESENSASDNADDLSEKQVSGNSVSGDSVSEDAVSENSVSENGVSENSVSENSVSENSVSENSVSENSVTLETEVDGITISLSGPESSFEIDKELSIQAKKVKDDDQIEAIEKAVGKLAEKKDKEVKDYQAFDIKLLADKKEVQPLGPVEVKFSGKKVEKAVENKKTDVEVLHVDDETGKSKDMKATATEEKEVVIETEHFSVYVYVSLADIFGKIKVTVQHWGENIEILDGTQRATEETDDILRLYNEGGIDKAKPKLKSEKRQLYTSDEIEIPNEYYKEIEELSKVCKVDEDDEEKRYTLSKVWIGKGGESNQNTNASWSGTYQEYINQNGTWKLNGQTVKQITLSNPSIIRFWYTPKEREKKYDATFYDYNITTGKQAGSNNLYASEKGVNSSTNYVDAAGKPLTKTTDRLGIGQFSSGNVSPWTLGAKIGNKLLNKGQGTDVSEQVVKGIVDDFLVGGVDDNHRKGNLKFKVTAPKGLLDTGTASGTTLLPNYKLGFNQKGDTYILDKVYDSAGHQVEENLSEFWAMQNSYSLKRMIYSNNFWPMDEVKGKTDPLMGNPGKTYQFVDNNGAVKYAQDEKNDDIVRYSSTEGAHNWHFGMRYSVDFTIGDYTGPMEYYFRGDDDFWLFVDGELAVDIGGVHRALGESLDLWTWMREHGKITYDANGKLQNKNQEHTLDIFFMERGGTGSCCYMQFTVPNTKTVEVPEPETTEYSVTKNWDDYNSPYRPKSIKVRLVQEWGPEGNKQSRPTEEYTILSAENDWKHTWTGIPLINGSTSGKYNYSYKVEEVNLPPGYTPVLVGGKLTNQLKPVKVEVEKVWQNDEGLEKYRPKSITLQLYANGEPYKDNNNQTKTITLPDENGNWSGVFENLPEYCNYRLISGGSDPSQDRYDADKVIYSVRELDANGNPIESNGYLTATEGGKYQVTYDPEPTVTPPTSSAPNKAPAFSRPSQEMPGLDDEAGPDESEESEENTEEVEEGDEESGDQAVAGDEGADDSGNSEITIEELEADAEGYEADFSGKTTVMNAAATFDAASYDTSGVAPTAEGNTAPPAADGIAAELTVTNTLVKNFKIVKKSSVSEDEVYTPLEGAEFTLTPCSDSGVTVEGGEVKTITSGKDGTITLDCWEQLQVGQYYLMEETKAPVGYMLSRTKWIIKIVENFGMKEIGEVKSFDDYSDYTGPGEKPTPEIGDVNFAPSTTNPGGLTLTYTFYNDEIYELPSTGGIGTYWYTISGMLLMMGASLILYKNRRRQAVRR